MLKTQLALKNLYFIPGKIGHNELSFYEQKIDKFFRVTDVEATIKPKKL